MSNHSGSYMLNATLRLLDEYQVFNFPGKQNTIKFLQDINYISNQYDGNFGEVLEELGEEWGICYECIRYSDNIEYGICKNCLP